MFKIGNNYRNSKSTATTKGRGVLGQGIQEWAKTTNFNLWKTAFKKFEVTISLQIFKGCLPEILLGPFLNTLTYMYIGSCQTSMIKLFRENV